MLLHERSGRGDGARHEEGTERGGDEQDLHVAGRYVGRDFSPAASERSQPAAEAGLQVLVRTDHRSSLCGISSPLLDSSDRVGIHPESLALARDVATVGAFFDELRGFFLRDGCVFTGDSPSDWVDYHILDSLDSYYVLMLNDKRCSRVTC